MVSSVLPLSIDVPDHMPFMESVVEKLDDCANLYWVTGADHAFNVLVRSGRTSSDVLEELPVPSGLEYPAKA